MTGDSLLTQLDCPGVQPMSKLPAQISTKSTPLDDSATLPSLHDWVMVTLSLAVLPSSSLSLGVAMHSHTSSTTVSPPSAVSSVHVVVSALLYAAGGFSQPKALELGKVRLDGVGKAGGVLAALHGKAKKLPRAELEGVARTSGARIVRRRLQPAGRGALGTSLRFPLGGPLRAGMASREIAEQLEL